MWLLLLLIPFSITVNQNQRGAAFFFIVSASDGGVAFISVSPSEKGVASITSYKKGMASVPINNHYGGGVSVCEGVASVH